MHLRKPSPGTAIALLALFFAMGGTAIAAHHYLLTKTSQISPKLLKALKGNSGKAGPTGKEGATGKEGPTGKEGKEGKGGKEGPKGSALAYAHITAAGTLDEAGGLTSGFAGAEIAHSAGTGVYCISKLPFTPHSVVVEIDSVFGPAVAEASVKPETFVFCPSTDQVEYVTFNPNTGAKEFKFLDMATFVLLN
jgi:hypothetical protein